MKRVVLAGREGREVYYKYYLSVGSHQAGDVVQLVAKAHGEHAVGLVQHEERGARERDLLRREEVEEAPRGGHHRVEGGRGVGAFQLGHLRVLVHAPVEHHARQPAPQRLDR